MKDYKITKLTDENLNQLILCEDERDMMGKGFYGPYEKVDGDENVPTIYYNSGRSSEMKAYCLKSDYEAYVELSKSKKEEDFKKSSKKKK